MTTIITEEEKEFGEFGEIAVKVCFICGKTIRKTNCYDFERVNPNNTNGVGLQASYTPRTKHNICLKCLLKGIFGICKTKEEENRMDNELREVLIAGVFVGMMIFFVMTMFAFAGLISYFFR